MEGVTGMVREIRLRLVLRLHSEGFCGRAIASSQGVSRKSATAVLEGANWRVCEVGVLTVWMVSSVLRLKFVAGFDMMNHSATWTGPGAVDAFGPGSGTALTDHAECAAGVSNTEVAAACRSHPRRSESGGPVPGTAS